MAGPLFSLGLFRIRPLAHDRAGQAPPLRRDQPV